jgi:putative membrane protein
MRIFLWIAFLIIVMVAIFVIQNSAAPLITIRFLLWRFETSLVYVIFGSIGLGILLALLFWISGILRASFRSKNSNQGFPSA